MNSVDHHNNIQKGYLLLIYARLKVIISYWQQNELFQTPKFKKHSFKGIYWMTVDWIIMAYKAVKWHRYMELRDHCGLHLIATLQGICMDNRQLSSSFHSL